MTHASFLLSSFQLSLAKPVCDSYWPFDALSLIKHLPFQLCYARGTVIPCFLTLENAEPRVLDMLAAPTSVVLTLRRRVRFYNKTSSSRRDVAWNETVEDMGTAVWWPSTDSSSTSTVRYLEGEIRLAKDLRPTSEMGHFSISVSLLTKVKSKGREN